jgi:16S rRNA processing protein RimM
LTASERRVAVGRVGRPHGRDGSFHVEQAHGRLEQGSVVTVAGREATIERRAGTAERPLVRLSGVLDRESARALRGEALLVADTAAPLREDEWLVEDLVGCEVEGLGPVRAVIPAPSCDLLEVGQEGVLVPFVSDAIRRVDVERRRIEVDHAFLALEEPRSPQAP